MSCLLGCRRLLPVMAVVLSALLGGCAPSDSEAAAAAASDPLVGAWRSKVQFTTGAFASVKDLEFLFVFNQGGTMTESSNYDGTPPVPPAYGVWRKTGPGQYTAKYVFYATTAPKAFEEISKGGGWAPAGRGELTETIRLAADGGSFESTIEMSMFDTKDRPVGGVEKAVGKATAIKG